MRLERGPRRTHRGLRERRLEASLPVTRLWPALHLVTAAFARATSRYQMTGVTVQLFEPRGVPTAVNAAGFITHLRYFFI